MFRLRYELHAAGVVAPGIASLADLLWACRAGQMPPRALLALPPPAALPANDRRRASQVVRLALACIEQALAGSPFDGATLRSVFATDEGTGEVCQQLLEAIATNRQVSPLLFTNSVQNAASGYFSIGHRNRRSATTISLGLDSFAAGLMCAASEARTTGEPVLLVAYDPAMTAPIDELLPVTQPTAAAWILSAGPKALRAPVVASFEIELAAAGSIEPSPLPGWLPQAWAANASVHALAALALLAEPPDTVRHLALGRQVLSLRRVGGSAT